MNTTSRPFSTRGVSLIELMVALAISALLLLGISEIFIGSKTTYSVQQGMSRSQENARFVINYFEDHVRMAGYYGCSNDTNADSSFKKYNHIPVDGIVGAADTRNLVRFTRPIEGFDYSACSAISCDTDGNQPAAGGAGEWSPSLDTSGVTLSAAARPVKGSDVLVLRVVDAASAPATGPFDPTTGVFTLGGTVDPNFAKPNGVYAVSNCDPRIDFFLTSAGTGNSVTAGSDVNLFRQAGAATTWLNLNSQAAYNQPPSVHAAPANMLRGEVHPAEYLALFVGLDDQGNPALKVQHYSGAVAGGLPELTVEELADGVEAMQLQYGVADSASGGIGTWETATQVAAGTTGVALDANWKKVLAVRVGLLMRGQDISSTPANATGNQFTVADAAMTRPSDGRYRGVFETTISLRNRSSF